jgi:hypothetical protein
MSSKERQPHQNTFVPSLQTPLTPGISQIHTQSFLRPSAALIPPILRLLLINEVLHNSMQRIVSPRNKKHIISRNCGSACVAGEGLEVRRNICWLVLASHSPKRAKEEANGEVDTNLLPDHLCQCANELRSCVHVQAEGFFIYDLAD